MSPVSGVNHVSGMGLSNLARPEGFEPPTAWFVARYSIQLSYGRMRAGIIPSRLKPAFLEARLALRAACAALRRCLGPLRGLGSNSRPPGS